MISASFVSVWSYLVCFFFNSPWEVLRPDQAFVTSKSSLCLISLLFCEIQECNLQPLFFFFFSYLIYGVRFLQGWLLHYTRRSIGRNWTNSISFKSGEKRSIRPFCLFCFDFWMRFHEARTLIFMIIILTLSQRRDFESVGSNGSQTLRDTYGYIGIYFLSSSHFWVLMILSLCCFFVRWGCDRLWEESEAPIR